MSFPQMNEKLIQVEDLKKKIEESFKVEDSIKLRMGMLFYEAQKRNIWELESLKDFLGSLNRKKANTSTVNRRMNLYHAFCIVAEYDITDIDTVDESRLLWMRKKFYNRETQIFNINKDNLAEWLAKAKTLSTTDWSTEKKQYERPVPKDHECSPDSVEKKVYWDCKTCGARHWERPNQLS